MYIYCTLHRVKGRKRLTFSRKGAKEDIWAKEEGFNSRMEKLAGGGGLCNLCSSTK
jgi:hypothetical protein